MRLPLVLLCLLTACRPMSDAAPDVTFQTVQSALLDVPDLYWTPCQGGSSDYRYATCYVDDSPNLTDHFRQVVARLEAAGFSAVSTGNPDTDLSATLRARDVPAELTVTYNGPAVRLTMQHPETGKFGASGTGLDGMRPYVRQTADGFARQMLYALLISGDLSLSEIQRAIRPCGQPQPGRLCAQTGWTAAAFRAALALDYFVGDDAYLARLDAQPTFVYAEEPLLERREIERAAIRVEKLGEGRYRVQDQERYPDVQAVLTFTPGAPVDLQVDVTDRAGEINRTSSPTR